MAKRIPLVLLHRLPAKASPSVPKNAKKILEKKKYEEPQPKVDRKASTSDEWLDFSITNAASSDEESIETARDAETDIDDIFNASIDLQPKNSTCCEDDLEYDILFQTNLSPISETPAKKGSEKLHSPDRPSKPKRKKVGAKTLQPKKVFKENETSSSHQSCKEPETGSHHKGNEHRTGIPRHMGEEHQIEQKDADEGCTTKKQMGNESTEKNKKSKELQEGKKYPKCCLLTRTAIPHRNSRVLTQHKRGTLPNIIERDILTRFPRKKI